MFSICLTGGAVTSEDFATWISTRLVATSGIGLLASTLRCVGSGIFEGTSILRRAWSWGLLILISVLRGPVSGGLCPNTSALLRPNLDAPEVEFSTCLDEISMEISVLLDTGSGCFGPESSTLLREDLGDLWLEDSTCLEGVSEFLLPSSWNFWAELDTVDLTSGLVVLLCGVEEFACWSTSSTSNDLFKAEKYENKQILQHKRLRVLLSSEPEAKPCHSCS